MASQRLRYFALMIVFLVGVAACGGGTQLAGGGIGGTGVSQGPITGYGSIWVNGVEFNTNNVTISKDGTDVVPATLDELKQYLKIGMVVTVDGTINSDGVSGTANTVTYAKELEGPITAITLPNTIAVLGQTVIVDNATKIEVAGTAASINSLAVKDVVEVSGFLTANGIRATYIEAKAGSTAEYELKGTITNIANTILTIGTQTVDINGAVYDFTPKNDDYVEVKGTLNAGGTFAASSMELKTRSLGKANAEKAELQGYVTSVTTAATDFVLNAQPVHIDSQTKFNGGAAADIKPGLILEVEGSLVGGVLNAAKISFEDDLELEGTVASIDTSTKTVTLDSYPSISISFNDILTELEGVSNFSLINVGDLVKVRARNTCSPSQCILATQLTVESTSTGTPGGSGGGSGGTTASTNIELQGHVDNIVPGLSITVLGVTVDTASITSFSGDGISDSFTFFENVKIGDLVDVSGTQTSGAVTWQAIEVDH